MYYDRLSLHLRWIIPNNFTVSCHKTVAINGKYKELEYCILMLSSANYIPAWLIACTLRGRIKVPKCTAFSIQYLKYNYAHEVVYTQYICTQCPIKTNGSVSCGPRSRRVTPVSILTGRKKTQFSHLRSSVLP